MARDFGPFPSKPMYEVVNRRMQKALAEATASTGFAKSGQGAVTAGTGAQLVIAAYPDGALIDGLYVENPASETVTLTTNTGSTNPRIDRLVMRLDMGAETIAPFQIVGTPAASPSAPPLVNTGTVVDMPLCRYTFPGSASAQNPGSIVDERVDTSRPFGMVQGTGTQPVGSGGSYSGVILATARKVQGGMTANGTGLVVGQSGFYLCSGMVEFSGNVNGRRLAVIGLNGVVRPEAHNSTDPDATNSVPLATATVPIAANAGDVLSLMGFQDSGAILDFNRAVSFLQATYIGPL